MRNFSTLCKLTLWTCFVWYSARLLGHGHTSRYEELEKGVFPRLTGGMGNQMFILSAAAIISKSTNRKVYVNAKQTGVFSYGVPQPVFWHTIFHSDFFVKVQEYDEGSSRRMNESDFQEAMETKFASWHASQAGIFTEGAFLTFKYNFPHRRFLLQLYEPTAEMQRWVNDAAAKLGIVLPGKSSSLPASYFDPEYARHSLAAPGTGARSHIIKEVAPGGGWSCDWPPSPCELEVGQLECTSVNCENNVALHIRLQDRSTTSDYWDESHMLKAVSFVSKALAQGANVVVFSNDPVRAESLLKKSLHDGNVQIQSLRFSSTLDVVEFGLLSQYFGTHILTGSTYQLWALFLTTLKHVKVKLIPGIDDIGFVQHAIHWQPDLYDFEEI